MRCALSQRVLRLVAVAAVLWILAPHVEAHIQPLSTVNLRLGSSGIDATVEAPAIDFAHDLPDATPDILLKPPGLKKYARVLTTILATRLIIQAGGKTLTPQLRTIEPLAERQAIRLRLLYKTAQPPRALAIRCQLFPYDPRHKTFLNIYQNDALERQLIFTRETAQQSYTPGNNQGTLAVIRQFVFEGVHHIFLGPDHILFIVGLLLLGGTLRQLLKIVTAFTLAHSVTLALATLGILNPPARVIEPLIALSIVFVGLHDIVELHKRKGGKTEATRDLVPRDGRVLFAFAFGFIHGFGFANVLREMELPARALVWSLFSFNLGVEFGQAAIVLAVAPLLALTYKRSQLMGWRIASAASLAVILMGAFWFIQRVSSAA